MKEKVEREINRILELMSKSDEGVKIREYALAIESLVLTFSRLK